MTDPHPLLRACNLWERTSAGGRRYLMGRMGGLRMLVFENTRRADEGEPSHFLLFGEAPPRERPGGRPSASRQNAAFLQLGGPPNRKALPPGALLSRG